MLIAIVNNNIITKMLKYNFQRQNPAILSREENEMLDSVQIMNTTLYVLYMSHHYRLPLPLSTSLIIEA